MIATLPLRRLFGVFFCAAIQCAVIFCAGPLAAEEAGFRHVLFDGQDLANFQVYNCDAGVENGLLKLRDGNGWLRARQVYTDFVLEIDWRALKPTDYDSGIYIRAELPAKAKANWPNKYQINLKQGQEGDLLGLKDGGGTSKGLTNPAGEWNHFRVTMIGDKAEMEINGKPAWKAEGIANASGFVGIQCEAPLGGQYEFKNIVVTELGYRGLLNGKDLAGWHVSSQTGHSRKSGNTTGGRWVWEDGAVVGSQDIPGNGGIVLTDEQFGDFEVALEMKNDFGPDSGLFLRSNERGQAYQYMVDYHAKGNLAGVYGEGLTGKINVKNFDFLDAVTNIAPHESTSPLPISPEAWPAFWVHGQWNELRARIVANPPKITTWINGVRFVEFEDAEKRHPDTGSIALQVHGGGDSTKQFVRYRNVRVKTF